MDFEINLTETGRAQVFWKYILVFPFEIPPDESHSLSRYRNTARDRKIEIIGTCEK